MSDENDLGTVDPAIAGAIRPGEDDESPPWHVVRQDHEIRTIGVPNVRPCNHRRFVVDKKFRTVTCRDCSERIDPIAALLVVVDWYEHLERKRIGAVMAEKSLHIARLRQLKKLKINTPQHLTEIALAIREAPKLSPAELRSVITRIEEQHRALRSAMRKQRKRRENVRVIS